MSWRSLGVLTLSYQWQTFDAASINSETFRVSQPGVDTVDGFFLIRPYYYSDVGAARRFYPSDEAKIVEFRLPEPFQGTPLGVRYFGARLSNRARIFAGQTWRVELEEFF